MLALNIGSNRTILFAFSYDLSMRKQNKRSIRALDIRYSVLLRKRNDGFAISFRHFTFHVCILQCYNFVVFLALKKSQKTQGAIQFIGRDSVHLF